MIVPIELQVWNAAAGGEYFGHTAEFFLRKIRHQKGFPKPLHWSEGGQPRWSAKAVIDWALS